MRHVEPIELRQLFSTTLDQGVLRIDGSSSLDVILVELDSASPSKLKITENGSGTRVSRSSVTSIVVNAGAGNDRVEIVQTNGTLSIPATLFGADGNDTLIGGAGRDRIEGGNGNDRLIGNGSSDTLRGGGGRDFIQGGPGRDNLLGQGGADSVIGGSDPDSLHDIDGSAERIDQNAADLVIHDGLQYSQINDFTYQLQNINLNTIGNSKFDLAVVDYSLNADEASKWTRDQIAALQNSSGGPKKVLAYLSIGEAEDYRFYWQTNWDQNHDGRPDAGAPAWLGNENPDWPGNYKVRYWQPDWQKIVFSYLDKIIAQGFDGIYLDIVDAFEYWGPDDTNLRPTAEQDMVNFVKAIATHSRVTQGRSDFAIFPQNGEALGTHADYLSVITGIGHEDVYYNDDSLNASSNIKSMRTALNRFKNAGKPVLVIDYPLQKTHIDDLYGRALSDGYVALAATRELDQLLIHAGHQPD